jgi:general secretion pathway protein J
MRPHARLAGLAARGGTAACGGIAARGDMRQAIAVRGFTLIELLVALLILGIMSAMGYGTYRQARIAAERAEESLRRTREIEFGVRVIGQDFAQLVPRPIRQPLGSGRDPALRAGPGAGTLIDLTRGGWSNTAGQQRSTLQRVSYQLVDDVLKRSYQTVLDPTSTSTPVVQNLLTGVKGVQLRFLDGNQVWTDLWPAPSLLLPDSLYVRPVAVEIVIDFKDWGKVRRLIEVAG